MSPSPFTILIPARNEANHIGKTLASIDANHHDLKNVHVNVIDDHSEDDTSELATNLHLNYPLKVIKLSEMDLPSDLNAYKKWGLQYGITNAMHDNILMTDGDCIVNESWIQNYAQFIQEKNVSIVTGPILYLGEKTILDHFQSLDVLGAIAVTAAGIQTDTYYFANGGNMYVNKDAFIQVGGYTGNTQYASGDDVFLIQKIGSKNPNQVQYLKSKSAAVYTHPEPTWRSFFHQRIRWSTKTNAYKNRTLDMGLALIFLHCLLTCITLALFPIYWKWVFPILAIQLLAKGVADFLYLRSLATYFDKHHLLNYFIPSFFLHILYIVVIGIASLICKDYVWKDRTVR